MEDVIYIILGLVWVVFSVINANKKKQQPASPGRPKSELEEIFGELFPKPGKNVTNTESIPYEEYSAEQDFPSAEESTQETLQPLGAYDAFTGEWNDEAANPVEVIEAEKPTVTLSTSDKHEQDAAKYEHFHNDAVFPLDLRKAIIYQAILQRPEY